MNLVDLRSQMRIATTFLRHRHLLMFLVRREIEQKYRGSVLGLFWVVLSSLLMLGIYTFVFNVIFVSRWPGMANDRIEVFAIVLFASLSMYNFASECWSRATSLVSDNATYVTKVVFPIELLPMVVVLAALFQFSANFAIVLAASLLLLEPPSLATITFLAILIPFGLFVLGVTYIIAFLSVFVRDMRMIVPFLLSVVFYVTPILYPIANTPERVRFILQLNPLSYFFEAGRGALFFGEMPDPFAWLVATCLSATVFVIGLTVFRSGSRAFADVL